MSRFSIPQFTVLAIGYLVVGTLSGCAAVDLFTGETTHFDKATRQNPVNRILCLWEPAKGQGLEGDTARGFAGQIFFFTAGSASPVEVDGDVRVYVFDDQGDTEEQKKPIHQFDFLGDAWKLHLQESQFGPAYSLFIPYTRKGNHEARCTLKIRFTPAEGSQMPVAFSDMADIDLPGKSTDKKANRLNGPAVESDEFDLAGAARRMQSAGKAHRPKPKFGETIATKDLDGQLKRTEVVTADKKVVRPQVRPPRTLNPTSEGRRIPSVSERLAQSPLRPIDQHDRRHSANPGFGESLSHLVDESAEPESFAGAYPTGSAQAYSNQTFGEVPDSQYNQVGVGNNNASGVQVKTHFNQDPKSRQFQPIYSRGAEPQSPHHNVNTDHPLADRIQRPINRHPLGQSHPLAEGDLRRF